MAVTPPRLHSALDRLAHALDSVEGALEKRAGALRERADIEEELALMQDDRSRLAHELDGALARARTLETARTEARQRIARAAGAIRAALGPEEAG